MTTPEAPHDPVVSMSGCTGGCQPVPSESTGTPEHLLPRLPCTCPATEGGADDNA